MAPYREGTYGERTDSPFQWGPSRANKGSLLPPGYGDECLCKIRLLLLALLVPVAGSRYVIILFHFLVGSIILRDPILS